MSDCSVSPSIPRIEQPAPQQRANFVDQLRNIDWFQFEKLVALAYENQGYHVTRRGGANPDGGIDLVIEKDSQQSAVQCKQWKTWNVGVKAVREFLGALTDAKIQHGIFITLNGYTGDAKLLAEKHGIEIINETGLPAAYLIKYFTKEGERWSIKPELKKNIEFRPMNLIQSWPIMPPFDLVFIRNVMIYFDVDIKKMLLKRIRNCLLPHGYLFLGTAETTLNIDPEYNPVTFDKTVVYETAKTTRV